MTKDKLISPALMWLIVIIGAILSFIFIGQQALFERTIINIIILIMAIIYWLYFFVSAWQVHKQALENADKIVKLVSNGIYSHVRHPMYSSDLILAWAFFVTFPYFKILVGVLWMTLILLFWIMLEEKVMIKKFGQEYKEYQKKVPMIIPKFN